jgi:hypothetical protein
VPCEREYLTNQEALDQINKQKNSLSLKRIVMIAPKGSKSI